MTIPFLVPTLTLLAALGATPGPVRAALAASDYRVEKVAVEGDPAHVVLTLRREMRTAGWDLRVEEVEPAIDDRTIRVRMVAVPPEGLAAQVITPREVRVDLGSLPPGRFVLEIWERTEGGGGSEPAHAEVLVVVGSPVAPGGR